MKLKVPQFYLELVSIKTKHIANKADNYVNHVNPKRISFYPRNQRPKICDFKTKNLLCILWKIQTYSEELPGFWIKV